MMTKDGIPLLQALIVGLLALFGIVITQSWTTRRDRAKRRIELAEEVLALFYEVREAIRSIRSPGGWVGEGGTRKRGDRETEEESKIMDNAFVVIERYKRFDALFSNLKSKKFRFMATFREDAQKPFDDIDIAINKIFIASHMLGSYLWKPQDHLHITDDQWAEHLRKVNEQEAVFWMMPDRDVITPIVDGAITKVETIADKAAKEYSGMADW
jgi:hypothetical protein